MIFQEMSSMNVDYFRYLALAGNFLNFRLCENQLGAQCLLGERGPLRFFSMIGHYFIKESCLVCVRVWTSSNSLALRLFVCTCRFKHCVNRIFRLLLSSLLTIPSVKMKTNSLAVDGSESVGLVPEDLGYFLLDNFFGSC